MKKGKNALLIFVFVTILLSLACVSAIAGKIGNGKMILDAEVGDTIDRTILVINDNNVSVNISIFPSGDLVKDTKIIDNIFILKPGEEKKARFTIKIKQPGTTNTRINVQFQPMNPDNPKESGIGLSAQVIVHAVGKGELNNEEENTNTGNNSSIGISQLINKLTNNNSGNNNGLAIVLGGMSLVFLIVLAVLLTIALKKKKSLNEYGYDKTAKGIEKKEEKIKHIKIKKDD